MHIPPIDPIGVRNGSFASRNEANKLLAQLAEGDVDLTLYGHIHSYYAFANAGIPAYISGGGGSIPERFDGVGRHYLTVDVDPVRGIVQTGLVRIDAE
jgi:predicted phosphodiesterase